MTLIALACKGDEAEFITDSMSYLRNIGKLSHSTKSLVLHHIDTAVLAAGDGVFGAEVKPLLVRLTSQPDVQSFDRLVETAPSWFLDLWKGVIETSDGQFMYDSTVFLVGYSDEAQAFAAYLFASEHDFAAEPISGLFLTPTPGSFKPSPLEAGRILRDHEDHDNIIDIIGTWTTQPERPIPSDVEDWARLALEARTRATQDFAKHMVGGSIYLTRLERGLATTTKLFDFDDTGDELLKLVGYTQHPLAQARPCWCDSGKTHLECHLADQLDEPCGCGTPGVTFRECCMVPRLSEVTT